MTAKEWCEELVKSIKEDAYNCECQEGGVDAMSIDTDWLREASRQFSASIKTIDRVRELADMLNKPNSILPQSVTRFAVAESIYKALDGEQ